MKRHFLLLLIFSFFITNCIEAQKTFMKDGIYSTDPINPNGFNNALFQELMIYKINNYMDSLGIEGYEVNEFFVKAAQIHAKIMAETQEASLEGNDRNTRTVRDRLISAGGSGIGTEFVVRVSVKSGNDFITYENMAQQILEKWATGKNAKDLFSQKYFFAGIAAVVDNTGKKAFASMYVGNYTSFNADFSGFEQLAVKPSTKQFGLKRYDEKTCRKFLEKNSWLVDLQGHLTIEDGRKIVLKYDNLKKLRRILKDDKDGLAIDIIQKGQFDDCNYMDNIVSYSSINLGYMLKPIFASKIFSSNTAPTEGKKKKQTKVEVVLGVIPDVLDIDDIELNLVMIKNRCACANYSQSYVQSKISDFQPHTVLLPDTIEIKGVNDYVPIATSTELNFRINFEKNKFNYKPEDMVPVLNALNEPSFIINKIFIDAHTSIEGTLAQNTDLQKKRAQSIVKALEQNQNASIVDTIALSTSFNELKTDVRGTKYETVANMSLNDAMNYVNARANEMEHILQKHRYADVVIWVTYDSEGAKEQKYVTEQFNEAVAAKQIDKALSIQKYILKRVVEGRYSDDIVSKMKIPQNRDCVGLNMNKIWLTQYINLDEIDEVYKENIEDLNKLDKSNIYVEYNDILCKVKLSDLSEESYINQLQRRVNALYNTTMNATYVDMLNIELQYQIIDYYQNVLEQDNSPYIASSLEKIKEIINFKEGDIQTAIKLALIFINYADYEYAIKILEPWVTKKDSPLVISSIYAGLCTKIPGKTHSNEFYQVMQNISTYDKKYFCELFKENKFSVQTFINTKVKDLHCKYCTKK